MINYNSIEEILSAGTTNMEVLRNNAQNDDGKDTIVGVDWFTFNGTVASTIYASGNSWIGFGSSSEHLKVNRIDGAMWSLYREEGTLFDYYKFLKIRWKGYSYYNQTSSSYAVEYDVILWDTGDISLHMVSIPTSNNTGTYSLTAGATYSYTVSTSNPNVTFTKTDNGFTISNNIIELKPFPTRRYLIRTNDTLYTITDGTLSALSTTELTSNTFLTYGLPRLTYEVISNCESNSEVLVWYDNIEYFTPTGIAIKGIPPLPQVVALDVNIGTNNVFKLVDSHSSSDVLFTFSYDGTNKYYYNNDIKEWVIADSDTDGMLPEVLPQLTVNEWSALPNSGNQSICHIYAALPTVNSYCKTFYYKTAERTT
jgi:hypothetical protein